MKINLKKAVTGSGIMLASGLMFASAHMGGMGGGFEGGMGGDMDSTRLTARFEQDAKMLGVNVSEVKDAWADGKSIFDLAKEKGIATSTITAKMQESRAAEMKTKMDALVTSGVITQAQADKKMANMKTMQDKMKTDRASGKMGDRDGKGKRGENKGASTSGIKSLWNKITN